MFSIISIYIYIYRVFFMQGQPYLSAIYFHICIYIYIYIYRGFYAGSVAVCFSGMCTVIVRLRQMCLERCIKSTMMA